MLKESLDGCAILLVEDDAMIAGDVTAIIELAGGRVVGPADSLGQGFHLLDSGRIDCAVLDINLNSLLVFGLADELAARNVPIVFFSADSPAEIPAHHRQRKFLPKPFTPEDLLAAIRTAMDESPEVAPLPAVSVSQQMPGDEAPMASA